MPSRRSTGRSWTPAVVTNLFTMSLQGYTQAQIARQLRRTPKAIERKVARLRSSIRSLPFATLARVILAPELHRRPFAV
jgi:hypothetical protein